MADTTNVLVDAVKVYFPTATFDTTTEAGYVRVGYNVAGITDKAVVTDIMVAVGEASGWAFDGYDEDGAACFTR